MSDDDLKDEAEKLFGRAKNDCRNTKLIVSSGIEDEKKGEKHEISTSTDFAGVAINPSTVVSGATATPLPSVPEKSTETKVKAEILYAWAGGR